jgi:hypothetical protein
MSLATTYTKAFDDNCLLEWETWFEADTPQQQLDLLDNLVVSSDVAEDMLLSGQTHWGHLGWWGDVFKTMEKWARYGHLIRIRLVAQWLLEPHPGSGLDPDVSKTLAHLAHGEICEVFPSLCCGWPARPEHYLRTLDWGMYEVAEQAVLEETAMVNTRIAIKYGRR